MQELARNLGHGRLALMKVPAHQKTAEYTNDLELGLIDGNNAADTAAQAANKTRPPAV
jgi:hypothetical protein